MKGDHTSTLKQLAIMGAITTFTEITSKRLGESIGISQQAASKEILLLAEQRLIERQIGKKGQKLMISETGLELLKKEYLEYKLLFEPTKKLQIHGIVFSGLGEGKYYISQQKYMLQFQKRLLFRPFEGTLNVRVAPSDMPLFERLTYSTGITIQGFVSKGRTFGDVKCFIAKMQETECAIILPVRTHYTDVMEIIAKEHLRSMQNLNDGDVVEIDVDTG
jgi:riboflavin kinase